VSEYNNCMHPEMNCMHIRQREEKAEIKHHVAEIYCIVAWR